MPDFFQITITEDLRHAHAISVFHRTITERKEYDFALVDSFDGNSYFVHGEALQLL
jgi:hypothetical protein